MPRGHTNKEHKRQQQGGMKFNREIKRLLLSINGETTPEHNAVEILISNVSQVKVVCDTSAHSFIFELTFPPDSALKLFDTYGLPLAESADTLAKFTDGTPELGTPVSNFCAKISFVDDVYSSKRMYKHVKKVTVSSAKANKEAYTQRMLFEEFACLSTTAPFVPDVIAHAILTRPQFQAMFGRILSSTASNEIYKWIMDWCAREKTLMVDVILMEMMDFERTAPASGVVRSKQFQTIHSLSDAAYNQAAIIMSAEIAAVSGKGIKPYDFHANNGLAALASTGLQVYLIDWGGLFLTNYQPDLDKVLEAFNMVCIHARSASATFMGLSLKDLCHFFEIEPSEHDPYETIDKLKEKFKTDLTTTTRDFACVEPTAQNVHHELMMVAFVDFMVNRLYFNHPSCQCGCVLKVVYPTTQSRPFDDFKLFLQTFQVDSPPTTGTNLNMVVVSIQNIVGGCQSVCALSKDRLRPGWMTQKLALEMQAAERDAQAAVARQSAVAVAAPPAELEAQAAVARQAAVAAPPAELEAQAAVARQSEALLPAEPAVAVAAPRPRTLSKPETSVAKKQNTKKALAIHHAKSAMTKMQKDTRGEAAVPTILFGRLSKWFSRGKGGTRKQRKQRKQRRCFTKRRQIESILCEI